MTRVALVIVGAVLGLRTGQGDASIAHPSSVVPRPAPSDSTRNVPPVLFFPEPGMDDTAAYRGYRTRLYRDAAGNAVQIYLEPRTGRVVLLWANALDESVGFTARDARGRPASFSWFGDSATVGGSDSTRAIAYRLTAHTPRLALGWFVLGSMRVERDFQYARRGVQPFTRGPFRIAEESLLVADIVALPAPERQRALTLLSAPDARTLEARLVPSLALSSTDTLTRVLITRPYLDDEHHLSLELDIDPRRAASRVEGSSVSIVSRSSAPIELTVRATTDAPALTPLAREEIFTRAFLDFLAHARAASDSVLHLPGSHAHGSDSVVITRARRLEREVRSVELLSSREKLMAGLPNFATYFGRDMLMSALMMRAIWRPEMSEHVIASVLRKLGPRGDVSHEEALGGQAIREHAVVYDSLLREWKRAPGTDSSRADSLLGAARTVLRELETVRENYHMMDDEFQLPILEARWLADPAVPADHKRAFLLDTTDVGEPRLARMVRELTLVAEETRRYAREPVATNLVSFVRRDSTHWRSASWRDSDAGYANGRFAMDINAIWAPRALAAMAVILRDLRTLGYTAATLDSLGLGVGSTPLAEYARDSSALARAVSTWRGARRHFVVALSPTVMRSRIRAKLAWMPGVERRYWERTMTAKGEVRDSLTFLALSLDSAGHPIPVVNTDPATELFLDSSDDSSALATADAGSASRVLEPFMRSYPVGLFIDRLGPVVANDAYASRTVWDRFRTDAYHSPRVVWGREVNLLLLGLANDLARATDDSDRRSGSGSADHDDASVLRDALSKTLAAVQASGLEHNELWSYEIVSGRLRPMRYGTGSDVQLWSTTDLAVQYVLSRLPAP